MTQRQQLIQWLVDDIAPLIKSSRHPEAEILKFAREHNLAPAQVQALGQMYNTGITLHQLEKSANRGADVKILDVDALVDKYTSIEAGEAKSASWNTHGIPVQDEVIHDGGSLPDCFNGMFGNIRPEITYDEINLPLTPKSASDEKNHRVKVATAKVELETVEQIIFDTNEDMWKIAREIEATLREDNSVLFEQEEADALGLHGEAIKGSIDKLAAFLHQRNVKVARAVGPRTSGLVFDRRQIVARMADFASKNELLKNAAAMQEALREVAYSNRTNAPGSKSPPEEPDEPEPSPSRVDQNRPSRPVRGSEGKAKGPSTQGQSKGRQDYFGQVGDKMDAILAPALNMYADRAKGVMTGVNNSDQRQVDKGYEDVKQMAMLQQLLTTDDVLSEADPEVVLERFNTIRQFAPSIAGDLNVMRVVLRSAIQHDGISPFDLKSIVDTELSTQKTDLGRRQLDAHLYRGAPLSNTREK